MAGIKFLETIALVPECIGQDADAKSAFIQIMLEEAAGILGED